METEDLVNKLDDVLEYLMDPIFGSKARGKRPIGICLVHVDDLLCFGEQKARKYLHNCLKRIIRLVHIPLMRQSFVVNVSGGKETLSMWIRTKQLRLSLKSASTNQCQIPRRSMRPCTQNTGQCLGN